ncbi:MAG: thioether cross-link-forming SCIFF peptide maturase [Syntrophomonadaceae bacterium]|nr:thioether cross-link-forming SCIFF peptide maturase [Syntrophomonadaceae bacterium]
MHSLAGYDFTANIHLYQYEDYNILLDVNSGAIHLLDEIAFAYINNLIKYEGDFYRALEFCTFKYGEEAFKVMEELLITYGDGAIFTEPCNEYIDYSQMTVKAVCLNIAHLCNLRCKYCFASQGNFGQKPALMPFEIGKRAIDFLVQESKGIRNLEVDFFGGEPLLNFAVVKEIVSYAREIEQNTDKVFNFTLTTNGVLLDEEIIDYIITENISIILSLDGRPETNDRNRVTPEGEGTYNTILPNFKEMLNRNPSSYYIRGTFTRDNLDFSQDLAHIVDLGFNSLSLEPAIGDDEYAIREEDLPQVLAEYDNLTKKLLEYYRAGQEISFFHYNLNLQKGPCIAKRQTGCGAGVEYIVVTPEGDIYPCHQFVGEKDYYMGNVIDRSLDNNIKNIFSQHTLANKAECQRCWARFFCGGGCHANNLKATNSLNKPDNISCIMHKNRLEGAIFLDLLKQIG